jgi:ADP-ribose pyrophosphatase
LELPAGKLDKDGENPLECGKRELLEETGVKANNYISLGRMYSSPGCFDEVIHMYLAQDLEYGEQKPDEDELIEIVRIPLEKAAQMVLDNEISDGKTQTAVLKTYLLLKKSGMA